MGVINYFCKKKQPQHNQNGVTFNTIFLFCKFSVVYKFVYISWVKKLKLFLFFISLIEENKENEKSSHEISVVFIFFH